MIMMDASWLWWMYGLWLMTTTEIVMIIMVVHHQSWSHLLIACKSSYIISSTTTHGTPKNLYNFWLYIAKSQNSLVSLWDFWGPHKFPFTWKNRQAIFQWQKSVIEKIRNQYVFPITDICHRKNTQPTNQWQKFLIEKLRSQLQMTQHLQLKNTQPTFQWQKYVIEKTPPICFFQWQKSVIEDTQSTFQLRKSVIQFEWHISVIFLQVSRDTFSDSVKLLKLAESVC